MWWRKSFIAQGHIFWLLKITRQPYHQQAETHAAHIPNRQNRISIGVFELCVRVCVWVWCYSYCSLPCCRPANYSCNQAFESHNNWHATVTTAATTRVKWFLDKSKIYNNKKQQQNTPHIEKEPLWNLFPGGYRPIPYHFLEFLFRSKMIIILFLSTVPTFNAWTCEMVRIFILFNLEWSVSPVVTQHQFGHWKSCCFYWRKWSHLHSSQTHTQTQSVEQEQRSLVRNLGDLHLRTSWLFVFRSLLFICSWTNAGVNLHSVPNRNDAHTYVNLGQRLCSLCNLASHSVESNSKLSRCNNSNVVVCKHGT